MGKLCPYFFVLMERQEIEIRKFQEADMLSVVRLIEDNNLDYGRPGGYIYGLLSRTSIFVADSNGDVVGTIVLEGPNRSRQSIVKYVAVDEEYRGNGLGARLLATGEDHLRSRNTSLIKLTAFRAQTRLINFYQNLGFKQVDSAGNMQKRL